MHNFLGQWVDEFIHFCIISEGSSRSGLLSFSYFYGVKILHFCSNYPPRGSQGRYRTAYIQGGCAREANNVHLLRRGEGGYTWSTAQPPPSTCGAEQCR